MCVILITDDYVKDILHGGTRDKLIKSESKSEWSKLASCATAMGGGESEVTYLFVRIS